MTSGTAPGSGTPGPAFPLTPSQTVGPFFSIGMHWPDGHLVVDPADPAALVLEGLVLDGGGDPVDDALVEVWLAGPDGRYGARPGFRGFGRAATDGSGRYELVVTRPGRVPGPAGTVQAPHLALAVFARGLLRHLITRCYFPDEAAANALDPVLALVPPTRRDTLLAVATPDGRLRFDVHLQGPRETVFLAL